MRAFLSDCLSLHITDGCNLRCNHCYQKHFLGNKIKMEDVIRGVELFAPHYIFLYGGEPMLMPHLLLEIMKKYRDKKFVLYTNGTIYNEAVYNEVDKIVVTLESFFNKGMNRRMTDAQYDNVMKLIRNYRYKVELLHNIYPYGNDKTFYKIAMLAGLPVQNFMIALPTEEMEFEPHTISTLHFEQDPLTKPKFRILTDGTVTRDMRGIYNICHVNDFSFDQDFELPIHEKCRSCAYFCRCPACNIFPHFCYDILNQIERPHFCRYTEALWKSIRREGDV